MEHEIYKPSIYKGPTVYNTGAEGGRQGYIFDLDFTQYSEAISTPYLYPQIGYPLWFGKSLSNLNLVPAEGLKNTNSLTGTLVIIPIPFFSGCKVSFYQKTKGIQAGLWSRMGLFCNGYTNTYSSTRGMGTVLCSDVIAYGNFLNGHSADWGFTESSEPASSMLIVPSTRLYPIADKVLESESIFDTSKNSLLEKINGVDAFYAVNIPDKLFYAILAQHQKFIFSAGGDSVYVQRCKIEVTT